MATPYYVQRASGAVNTLTVAGVTSRTLRLMNLVISVSGQPAWATSPNLKINDGSTTIFQCDLPPSGSAGFIINVPLPIENPEIPGGDAGLIGGPGNAMVIIVASPGGTVKTDINAKVVLQ